MSQTASQTLIMIALASACTDKDAEPTGQPAEILLVLDNSQSMPPESAALTADMAELVQPMGSGYRVGITTTTSISGWTGASSEADPGEAGTLVAQVRDPADAGVVEELRRDIACRTTCWNGVDLPEGSSTSEASGECSLPEAGVTSDYLACMCGDITYPWQESVAGTWDSELLCGAELETPMESALLAMCRAASDPPDICWDHTAAMLDAEEATHSTKDFLREDTPVVVLIITDSGDASPMYSTTSDSAGAYLNAFSEFDRDIIVHVIGPQVQCEGEDCSLPCTDEDTSVMEVSRLRSAASGTGGLYLELTGSGTDCSPSDMGGHLAQIAQAITEL